MTAYADRTRGLLDAPSNATIDDIRSQLSSVRKKTEKLRTLFTETLLTDDWVHTRDLMVITGLGRGAVYRGIVDLWAEDTIEGKEIPQVTYFESLKPRSDRGARLLLSLAGIRMECEPDDLPFVALTVPDRERETVDGAIETVQFSGFYWRKAGRSGGGSSDDIIHLPVDSGIKEPVLV